MRNVRLTPVRIEHIEGAGYALHFFAGWPEPNQQLYAQITSTVSGFQGTLVKWTYAPEFNARGIYISAIPLKQMQRAIQGHDDETVSLNDLRNEFAAFCASARAIVQAGRGLSVSASPPSEENWDESFGASSQYDIFLVARPEIFKGEPKSNADEHLHIGISEDEWITLSNANIDTLPVVLADFILALRQRYDTIRVPASETQALSIHVRQFASDLGGRDKTSLDKLGSIFERASDSHLGVIFQPRD